MILTALDCEMTGLNPYKHELIDFAAITFNLSDTDEEMQIIKKINFKIKPERLNDAEPEALKCNGYNEKEWANAISLTESIPLMKEAIENSELLLGQYLIHDIDFIKQAFIQHNLECPKFPLYIDTKAMATTLYNQGLLFNTKIDYLVQHFGITYEGLAHTAITDCERTVKLFMKLRKLTPILYFKDIDGFVPNDPKYQNKKHNV